MIVFMGLTT